MSRVIGCGIPKFTKLRAEETAKNLGKKGRNGVSEFAVTSKYGGKHRLIKVRYQDRWIFSFCITYYGTSDSGHKWVHEQMRLNRQEGLEFAKCSMDVVDLVNLMQQRGLIE